MHRLLYYPNFEIRDENFLKFALLYIDEIRPIIPASAKNSLSDCMHDIIEGTDLINPYEPDYEKGKLASIAAIKHLEQKKVLSKYEKTIEKSCEVRNYKLYSEKFVSEFENYCLDNGLCERCDEGILLHDETAFAYMSILAEIISKEENIDMITDIRQFSDPLLRSRNRKDREAMEILRDIRREIEFYVPCDMRKIPLIDFIELRSDHKFEKARQNFVKEINRYLDHKDKGETEIDIYDVKKCREEIYGLLKGIFATCAMAVVGVHSFGDLCMDEKGILNFWAGVGGVGISLGELKHCCYEARHFAKKIEGKRQARKYLAKLRQLMPETLYI